MDWYFDFISPFSYFQLERFKELPSDVEINFKPVVFAGLLNHWETKGPAELPAKRRFTYEHVQWYAHQHQIPFKFPSAHPFNPIKALRLVIALEHRRDVIETIFRFIWAEGGLVENPEEWKCLTDILNCPDADELVAQPHVKQKLIDNGEEAKAKGVFGVPTVIVDDELLWGVDATDMLFAYLNKDPFFQSEDFRRLRDLPMASTRK